MSNLKIVSDDEEFASLLQDAGDDLVIIDFFTTWCRPCRNMEPVFEAMALHYPKALFLKVDADKCFSTAMTYKVTGVPFFVIYFNKSVVETIQGANPQELELKIRLAEIESRKASTAKEQTSNLNTRLAAHVNPVISTFGKLGSVTPYIDPDNSHCLNDLSPTSFHNFIGGKKLVSGRGTGKILLVYSFTQKMMLQSFKIKANPQTGPRVLRFFVNHPKVLDFNIGSTLAPSQEVTLSHHDLTGDRAIELRSGSFQVVTNVQIFVTSGQSKNSRIEIDTIQLFGAPVIATQPLVMASDSTSKASNNNVNPATKEPTFGAKNKVCNNGSCDVSGAVPHSSRDDNDDDDDDLRSTPSQSTKSFDRHGHRHQSPQNQHHHRSHSDNNNDRNHGGHSNSSEDKDRRRQESSSHSSSSGHHHSQKDRHHFRHHR